MQLINSSSRANDHPCGVSSLTRCFPGICPVWFCPSLLSKEEMLSLSLELRNERPGWDRAWPRAQSQHGVQSRFRFTFTELQASGDARRTQGRGVHSRTSGPQLQGAGKPKSDWLKVMWGVCSHLEAVPSSLGGGQLEEGYATRETSIKEDTHINNHHEEENKDHSPSHHGRELLLTWSVHFL